MCALCLRERAFDGEKSVRSAEVASGMSCAPTVAALHFHW